VASAFLLATLLLSQVHVRSATTAKTRPHAVTVLAKLDPGEPLTFEKLLRAERELRKSNLFEDVQVQVLLPPEQAAREMYLSHDISYADVEIRVREKRFWYAFPFGSVSQDNLSAGAVVADVNLFGRARTGFLAGEYGNQTKQVFALYRDPAILGSRFVGYDLTTIGRDDHTAVYASGQQTGKVAVTQYGGAAQMRFNWHPEFATLFQASVDHLEMVPDTPMLLPPEVSLRRGLDVDLRAELRYDGRDQQEGFYRGALTRLWVELSDERIGSDYAYTREMMLVGGWFPIGKLNFSARGQAGVEYATGPGGIPFTKQFTLGGLDLRGYVRREFRGDTLFSLQTDLVVPLFQIWQMKVRGDLFYDAGAVYLRAIGLSRDDFRQGVGGGLRFYFRQLAIPVMGFDVGYGIDENHVGYYVTFGPPES
jgi:outer membrane protein assembly factor BamA